ncbi:hypothetical protein GXW77_18150 [Roseomonas alkaliterrae]|jgi:hypothetical protein|uniref:hypothetical protein n=1 Tax=Neoroseomonas alkaliterrae TaxID=1452450 RepID=UPI001BAB3F7E|nr:hypothetical protein [Neoroseomonas alkaliterrae]MBR0678097.1 hypothetical protein [Neoroseomonas alkaliterrae]
MSRFPFLEMTGAAFGLQAALEAAIRAGRLGEQAIAAAREAGLRAVKNAEPLGIPIEDQAEVGREALQHFEHLFEAAVVRARQADE